MTPATVIGIDVSQDTLDLASLPDGRTWQVAHTASSLATLVGALRTLAPERIVLEATGGLERDVVVALAVAELPVVVMNPRQVRDFAKAIGQRAKTDRLDALVLARLAQTLAPPVRPLPDAGPTGPATPGRRHPGAGGGRDASPAGAGDDHG